MSYEINMVIGAIQEAGGRIRSQELIAFLLEKGLTKRDIQLAVQTAFDKGQVKLDRDMKLIVDSNEVHQAA
jgi:DNA-binding transcriptional regulator PaaX